MLDHDTPSAIQAIDAPIPKRVTDKKNTVDYKEEKEVESEGKKDSRKAA
jgi:hypothetical protein